MKLKILLNYKCEINKLTSVFYASVLSARGSTTNFDNVMMQFIINKRTDA